MAFSLKPTSIYQKFDFLMESMKVREFLKPYHGQSKALLVGQTELFMDECYHKATSHHDRGFECTDPDQVADQATRSCQQRERILNRYKCAWPDNSDWIDGTLDSHTRLRAANLYEIQFKGCIESTDICYKYLHCILTTLFSFYLAFYTSLHRNKRTQEHFDYA